MIILYFNEILRYDWPIEGGLFHLHTCKFTPVKFHLYTCKISPVLEAQMPVFVSTTESKANAIEKKTLFSNACGEWSPRTPFFQSDSYSSFVSGSG